MISLTFNLETGCSMTNRSEPISSPNGKTTVDVLDQGKSCL